MCTTTTVFLLLCVLYSAAQANNGKDVQNLANHLLRNNPYSNINATNVHDFVGLLSLESKRWSSISSTSSTNNNEIGVAPFPCNLTGKSVPTPTNARRLQPADIDVVATLGDSVAAGFGALASSIFGVFTEYRGHTFSNGGEQPFATYVTVPSILKLYNPSVKGLSVGTGNAGSTNAKLNVAVSGARSYDLVSQYEMLLSLFSKEGVTNDQWKMISIFVGGNDLCDYCTDTTKNSPANYQKNIEQILDLIQANIPRVFVNLLAPPDVTLLSQVSDGWCSFLHGYECGCATNAPTSTAHKLYVDSLSALIQLPKYQSKEDFFVTLQPFLKNMVLPTVDGKPDRTYFAPDCFHFSGKAHQAAAVALWNNMVEEPANKKTSWVPGEPLECPQEFLM